MTQTAEQLVGSTGLEEGAAPLPAGAPPAPYLAVAAQQGAVTAQRKAVLVHAGARDGYQFALGLHEAGLLDALVTDLFWSDESVGAQRLARLLPGSLHRMLYGKLSGTLRKRSRSGLPASAVKTLPLAGLGSVLLDRLPRVPFALKRRCIRMADAALGRAAGRRARQCGEGLVSYSYTGYDAFREYGRGGMLFQVHPHPGTMRRILREELALHPECATTLEQEWELSLPEQDFQHLAEEPGMAASFLAASSFTRDSLVEHGIAPERVTVVPYGIDLERFRPDPARRALQETATPSPSQMPSQTPFQTLSQTPSPLKLLFVGRINQRKGLAYLLQALRLLGDADVELTICGRVLDDLRLFGDFERQVKIRPSVGAEELVQAYQSADLFVFPSVGEGFGQVLLESLASGLPILATTHTAAPDLIEDGVQGFIVEPRRPEELAERIRWALTHRQELAEMGVRARTRAEFFTWERFRRGTADAVRQFLAEDAACLPQGRSA